MITYEHLREWRDICEWLNGKWYKFVESEYVLPRFSVLTDVGKVHREILWSLYMIQFVDYGRHPHAFYHRKSPYRDDFGWRLIPDWEIKIDFLEQIILLGRNACDLPQPWKQSIWSAFFKKREKQLEQQRLFEEWRRQMDESARLAQEKRMDEERRLKEGDCPLKLGCQSMTGSFSAGGCSNFQECLGLSKRI